ncbi:MAG: hypothetical protein JW940_03450 [Polyangiaceae bacterium]|nr:hypothetical protein [Polyangiaceae bacterium]
MRAGRSTRLGSACAALSALGTLTLAAAAAAQAPQLFAPSSSCMACHNRLWTAEGEDISFGHAWQPTMMGNSARDPYWQAGVRRETLDHPTARGAIEDECSTCHMPMATFEAHAAGAKGSVFANLGRGAAASPAAPLAQDGVSCSVCHQIEPNGLGSRESFTGRFVVDQKTPWGSRHAYGPFVVDANRTHLMQSAARLRPVLGPHVRRAELCASCHTLITHALDSTGRVVGRLPEQVPYLEWLASGYRSTHSCQACHMPLVDEAVPFSSVIGQPRTGVRRHSFLGGNFFVLSLLGRHAQELGVAALPQESSLAVAKTKDHLTGAAAQLDLTVVAATGDRLDFDVAVTNRAGHKLPTAYPSRRVWLHVRVNDSAGRVVFESGQLDTAGAIQGNDNDRDPGRYEPHYERIVEPGEVQIYEAILGTPQGTVTTGLLSASQYLKDNRLTPAGFDKTRVEADVAVVGRARQDSSFFGGRDTVRYSVALHSVRGPLSIVGELVYQPIGYRWAQNLRARPSAEALRFLSYFDESKRATSAVLARASAAATARIE